jgi:hypothetical protein
VAPADTRCLDSWGSLEYEGAEGQLEILEVGHWAPSKADSHSKLDEFLEQAIEQLSFSFCDCLEPFASLVTRARPSRLGESYRETLVHRLCSFLGWLGSW